ncbi:hypothetical protein BGX38DRAFT_1143852 [Terfezia claveryi]|nr:hypothetical protein BGX38DRAFT_1143852 [Terfezia claveryi]
MWKWKRKWKRKQRKRNGLLKLHCLECVRLRSRRRRTKNLPQQQEEDEDEEEEEVEEEEEAEEEEVEEEEEAEEGSGRGRRRWRKRWAEGEDDESGSKRVGSRLERAQRKAGKKWKGPRGRKREERGLNKRKKCRVVGTGRRKLEKKAKRQKKQGDEKITREEDMSIWLVVVVPGHVFYVSFDPIVSSVQASLRQACANHSVASDPGLRGEVEGLGV